MHTTRTRLRVRASASKASPPPQRASKQTTQYEARTPEAWFGHFGPAGLAPAVRRRGTCCEYINDLCLVVLMQAAGSLMQAAGSSFVGFVVSTTAVCPALHWPHHCFHQLAGCFTTSGCQAGEQQGMQQTAAEVTKFSTVFFWAAASAAFDANIDMMQLCIYTSAP